MTDDTYEPGRITQVENAVDFIFGGNAYFTFKSVKTGTRYTYRVSQTDFDPNQWFVSYLTGPDNGADYTYLGMITQKKYPEGWTKVFRSTKKTKLLLDSGPFKAFNWAFHQIMASDEMPKDLEMWHEGRCGRCGRRLTVPESVASGFGPECIQMRGNPKHDQV